MRSGPCVHVSAGGRRGAGASLLPLLPAVTCAQREVMTAVVVEALVSDDVVPAVLSGSSVSGDGEVAVSAVQQQQPVNPAHHRHQQQQASDAPPSSQAPLHIATHNTFTHTCSCSIVGSTWIHKQETVRNKYNLMDRVAQKTGPLRFTVCNFRSIDQICTKFGTDQRYFVLNNTSQFI